MAQVDLEVADEGGDEGAFDGLDREQAGEDGAVELGGDSDLGTGGEAAIEAGDEQVSANGGAGAALGDMAVGVLDEA